MPFYLILCALGDGYTIAQAQCIADRESDSNVKQARVHDAHIHWSEVNLFERDPVGEALFYLDPSGYRFHIPAYLITALKHGHEDVFGDGLEAGSQISSSIRSSAQHTDDERFSLFDRAQLRCIARYLAFVFELNPYGSPEAFNEGGENHWFTIHWIPVLSPTDRKHFSQLWPKIL